MRSERCERCPDEDTEACDTCNQEYDSRQDDLMREVSERFIELRNAVWKEHFGKQADVKAAALKLSEGCLKLVDYLQGTDERR
jgi:hypothetical protein